MTLNITSVSCIKVCACMYECEREGEWEREALKKWEDKINVWTEQHSESEQTRGELKTGVMMHHTKKHEKTAKILKKSAVQLGVYRRKITQTVHSRSTY